MGNTKRVWEMTIIKQSTVLSVLLTVALAWVVPTSKAATYSLTNGTSTATYDTANGLTAWTANYPLNGMNVANQQQFWYRIGSSNPEASIGTLTLVGANATDANFDGYKDTLSSLYTNAASKFTISVSSFLIGYAGQPAGENSDINTTIKITNLNGSALDFHLFLYSDFNLGYGGGSDNDIVQFLNSTTVIQSNNVPYPFGGVLQTQEISGLSPTEHEANTYPATFTSLTNSSATTLSGAGGPLTGNATWAFEWDMSIGANSSQIIQLDNQLQVPEPSSLMLGLGGLLFFAAVLRRRIS
ncbi:MAG TPA: PEP-CTERM sorting domain-containing protein [Verrucomicrobiae bacterium]|nr:PEP-CTERM sorting domain-containing protein [Verrucomicrobiae bacterium]